MPTQSQSLLAAISRHPSLDTWRSGDASGSCSQVVDQGHLQEKPDEKSDDLGPTGDGILCGWLLRGLW